MKYSYFPGCSLEGSEKEYNISTKAVCERLGIEIEDIEDWNCCGASAGHNINYNLSLLLPARNIAIAEQSGSSAIIAPCSECYHNLKWANDIIRNNANERLKVNHVLSELGLSTNGKLEVRHLLDVIANDIGKEKLREKQVIDMQDLNVAPYYGCLVSRPPDIGFDSIENPQSLDIIAEAFGANVVDFEDYKTACCGGALILPKEDVALKMIKSILLGAKKAKADCIIVPCPMCHMNVDAKQMLAEEMFGLSIDIPVLYFTQFIGLAMGMKPDELALDKNVVSTKKVLDKLGIEYEEEKLSMGRLSVGLEESRGKRRLIFELG